MKLSARIGAALRVLHKGQTLDHLPGFMFGRESKTGISVSWSDALLVSTVLACVSRLGDGVAMPPCKVMKPLPKGGAEPWTDHHLYRILARRPNRWQTSFEFRQTIVFHRALTGNAFIYKSRVGGRIRELIPIEPGKVTVKMRPGYEFSYLVTGEDGTQREFPAEDIWHLRGPSWNSWMGMETVKLAREAIGLSLATEETHALFHRNGAQMSGVYSIEGTVEAADYEKLQGWIDKQLGGANRHKPFILDRNGRFLQTQMSGVDSEHLATRRHQIEEICRAFNVRPIMVMHSVKEGTFASSEQAFLAHGIWTLNPWWEEFQQSAEVNLLDDDDEAIIRLNGNILLRGSMQAEADYLYKATGGKGWLTQNDARKYKDLAPMDGGDELPQQQGAAPSQPAKTDDEPPEPEPDVDDQD